LGGFALGEGLCEAANWAGWVLFRSTWPCNFMISLEDCVALSGLTEEQVLAIAEHEHLPEMAATALAQYLLRREQGMEKIRDMIVDDIRRAQQREDKAHTLTLLHVLHHFLKSHPEVCPLQHPWSQLS
jgi:hypothetical protein